MISGPPGAGKSTVAAILAAEPDRSVLIEGDRFFGFLANGGIDPWLPESEAQNQTVTEAAAAATGRFAADYDTVYDGVVGPWFLPSFATATGLAELDYAIILPALETCLDRVRTRTDHQFSDPEATAKMHREFSLAEIDPRHVVSGGELAAAETAATIVSLRNAGRLRYVV